jgi:hypothetical protein
LNKSRRTTIASASSLLDRARSIIEQVLQQEQYAMENVPENLQESERYASMEDCVDAMEDAIESIREAVRILSAITE